MVYIMHTHQVWRQLQLVSHGSKLLENQKLFTFLQ
jgi:molybdopterin synthase catalytic subunit